MHSYRSEAGVVEVVGRPIQFTELSVVTPRIPPCRCCPIMHYFGKHAVEVRVCLAQLDLVQHAEDSNVPPELQWSQVVVQERILFRDLDFPQKSSLQLI